MLLSRSAIAVCLSALFALSCGEGGRRPVDTAVTPRPRPRRPRPRVEAAARRSASSATAARPPSAARARRASLPRSSRPGPPSPAEAPDLRQDPGGRRRHGPVHGPGQGGLPERPRRQPGHGRLLRPAGPRRLQLRAPPGQERERLLGELRRPDRVRLHAPQWHLPRDVHSVRVPGRTGRRPARRQRLRDALPAPDQPDELQDPPLRAGVLQPRLDRPRRARPGLLHVGRLHRRALALPGAPGGQPRAAGLRGVAGGLAEDTGRPGPTWTFNGKYCTGKESGCENHPQNQHALLVYTSGTFRVCAQTGSCCEVVVER